MTPWSPAHWENVPACISAWPSRRSVKMESAGGWRDKSASFTAQLRRRAPCSRREQRHEPKRLAASWPIDSGLCCGHCWWVSWLRRVIVAMTGPPFTSGCRTQQRSRGHGLSPAVRSQPAAACEGRVAGTVSSGTCAVWRSCRWLAC